MSNWPNLVELTPEKIELLEALLDPELRQKVIELMETAKSKSA